METKQETIKEILKSFYLVLNEYDEGYLKKLLKNIKDKGELLEVYFIHKDKFDNLFKELKEGLKNE
tara:strand:- start:955 stop:1152 length:198 start_codon:yes stop_codon:yes gene_type:complete